MTGGSEPFKAGQLLTCRSGRYFLTRPRETGWRTRDRVCSAEPGGSNKSATATSSDSANAWMAVSEGLASPVSIRLMYVRKTPTR